MKFNSITLTIELIEMAQAMAKIKRTEQGREKFGTFVNPWNCLCKMVHTGVSGFFFFFFFFGEEEKWRNLL